MERLLSTLMVEAHTSGQFDQPLERGYAQHWADKVLSAFATLTADLTDEAAYAHKLQVALTGLTLGGSENFVRHGDGFRADIPACVEKINRRHTDLFESFKSELRARKAAEAQLAAVTRERDDARAVPEGYALVPVEPTPEMRRAFHDAHERWENGGFGSPDHQWAAMLAASPSPSDDGRDPTVGAGSEGRG